MFDRATDAFRRGASILLQSLLIETHGVAGSHARGREGERDKCRQIYRISSRVANLSTFTLAPVARQTIYRPRVPSRTNWFSMMLRR
jgi:hypothetical protein